MSRQSGHAVLLVILAGALVACGRPAEATRLGPSPEVSPSSSSGATLAAASPSATPTPTPTAVPTSTPRIVASIDLAAAQAARHGAWTRRAIGEMPSTQATPVATYAVGPGPIANRDRGRISPTLVGTYLFLQFDGITPSNVARHAATFNALFVRSALMSFVDYSSGRVLGWDGTTIGFPLDVAGVVRVANQRDIPVFLELNYSDYVPGAIGSGVAKLRKADNADRTVSFLAGLADRGLEVAGVTFGDEWGDEAGFGARKPTVSNSDIVGRFIEYATALKRRFPALKVYAFDSSIGAASGELDQYWDAFARIRAAEVESNLTLLDGFAFRESYVYIDAGGELAPSQAILDDTELLAGDAPVLRFDTDGSVGSSTDRDYLHTLLAKTEAVFGRRIEIALTEYLPAGPVQIDESDTSRYPDIDFVVHYADVVGTFAALGLDTVSSFAFANSPQQAEAYLDRFGHRGAGYPVHEQLTRYLAGTMLAVDASVPYATVRVKVYAARSAAGTFVLLLNKDAADAQTVRLTVAGELDLTVKLPPRSYASLVIDGADVLVSCIGG